ncbi:hypothetical protein ACR0RJ_00855 [Escherichia coli]|uniref:hypothetical protein n=1 Tax=Escherichia coli TaxID=562 RepID=UPI003D97A4E7
MGKGGGKAHTLSEAKDNLKSTQMMSVIDAIGEGPIEGPVKGLQSILVNKTPLTDTDGNPVIHGVTAVWRAGEQEQTPPEGFESSGAETGLGVEVTKAKPVTRTITSANIDHLRGLPSGCSHWCRPRQRATVTRRFTFRPADSVTA